MSHHRVVCYVNTIPISIGPILVIKQDAMLFLLLYTTRIRVLFCDEMHIEKDASEMIFHLLNHISGDII